MSDVVSGVVDEEDIAFAVNFASDRHAAISTHREVRTDAFDDATGRDHEVGGGLVDGESGSRTDKDRVITFATLHQCPTRDRADSDLVITATGVDRCLTSVSGDHGDAVDTCECV